MPKKTKHVTCPHCGKCHDIEIKQPVSKTVGFHIRMLEEEIADMEEANYIHNMAKYSAIPDND